MRVFKLKAFARFQRRERLDDTRLAEAVRDAEKDLVAADLGGGLIKQRIARSGRGKSGGYRSIIAYRRGERAVFLYGFAKNERDNIGDEELVLWRVRAQALISSTKSTLDALLSDGELLEAPYYDD
jgi:hypothetical protein